LLLVHKFQNFRSGGGWTKYSWFELLLLANSKKFGCAAERNLSSFSSNIPPCGAEQKTVNFQSIWVILWANFKILRTKYSQKVQPIVVDVENWEDIILGDFFKFATCCKWKGSSKQIWSADLIGASWEHAHLRSAISRTANATVERWATFF
jgi:hypothetical protein